MRYREEDTITSVVEKEYRVSVNNLSLAVFFYGHEAMNAGVVTTLDVDMIMHIHSYTEIFCCVSDGASVMTPDGIIKLSRGDVALIPSNYPHFAFGNLGSLSSLGFTGSRVENKSTYNLYADFADVLEIKKARIYRGAIDVYNMLISLKDEKWETLSPMPALQFLFILKKLCEFEYSHVHSDDNACARVFGREKDIARFLLLEQLVSANYAEEFDVNEVAKRLCITRRHMDRIVKAHYGKTLRELVYEKRISYAKRLLVDGDETIAKIAHRIGFKTGTAFKNAFVDATGMTPSEYRIRCSQKEKLGSRITEK